LPPPDELVLDPELDDVEIPELDDVELPELDVPASSPESSAAGPSSETPLLLGSPLLLGLPLLLGSPLLLGLPLLPLLLLPELPLLLLPELVELKCPPSPGPSPGPLVAHEKTAPAASKTNPPAVRRP